MIKFIKSKGSIITIACLLLCAIMSKPIISLADEMSQPTASIDIKKLDKEYLKDDTGAIKSNDNITVDVLEDTLDTTSVVDLSSTSKLMKYLLDPSLINQFKLFRPSKVDNSQSKYFPKVINQGELNSCTTWSTVYYQMSYAVNKELDRAADNNDNVFSPTWIYNMTNEGENVGNYYADILKILSEIGAVPMSRVPAITTDEGDNVRNVLVDKDLWMEASKYKVKEYYSIDLKQNKDEITSITSADDKDLDAIKKALSIGEVLTGTTYAYKWNRTQIEANKKVAENKNHVGEYIVTDCTSRQKGAHRITIVGYNDKLWVDINQNGKVEKGEKGAFKIANSYGTSSDNNGFVWMSYDALNLKSCVAPKEEEVNENRAAGIFDVIGFNVDLDDSDSDCYAAIGVQTKDLKSINVKIIATDKEGVKHEYEPAPFTNAMIRGMGEYPFNSSENGDKGTFFIDLTNVVKGVTKENVTEYKWEIEIADTSENGEVIINDLKIYTKSDNTYSESYVDEPITINYDMAEIVLSKPTITLDTIVSMF